MKFKKALLAVLCFMFVCFCFAGCEWGAKNFSVYAISSDQTLGTVEIVGKTNEFKKGSEVTLIAKETNTGLSQFVNWVDVKSGQVVSINKTYTFKIDEDKSFVANFRSIFSISFDLQNGETLSGEKTINTLNGVKSGEEINLVRLTKKGYIFKGWKQGNNLIEFKNDENVVKKSFDVKSNITLTAEFEAKKYYPVLKIVDGEEVIENYNENKKFVLTFNQTIPELPKTNVENKLWEWSYKGEAVTPTMIWKEDIENENIVFVANVVNAKKFKFKLENGNVYEYKMSEKVTTPVTIANLSIFPNGTEVKGKTLDGFYVEGTEPTEFIQTISYSDDETKTYVAHYTKRIFHVNIDPESESKAIFEATNRDITFEDPFNFMLKPKVQTEGSEDFYVITRVYYCLENSTDEIEILANTELGSNGYTIASMPAGHITIYVEAKAHYYFDLYNKTELVSQKNLLIDSEVELEPLEDTLAMEFLGWAVQIGDNEVMVTDKFGVAVSDFWGKIVESAGEGYKVKLIAKWNELANISTYTFENVEHITEGNLYYLLPPEKNTHVVLDNSNSNLFKYLNSKKDLFSDIDINTLFGQSSEFEQYSDFWLYNLAQCVDETWGFVSSDVLINNLLIVDGRTYEFVNKKVSITAEFYMNGELLFSNKNNYIEKEKLESLKDGVTVKLTVVPFISII